MTEAEIAAKVDIAELSYVWCDLCNEEIGSGDYSRASAEKIAKQHVEEHVVGDYDKDDDDV